MPNPLRVEDIYELSPMQQGMLFHTLHNPDGAAYTEQNCYTLNGQLDLDAFREAWRVLVFAHPVLRTALQWEDLEQPVQVVFHTVSVDVEAQDWRSLSSEEQAAALEQFLAADRARGFILSEPPLMRWTILRLTERKQFFVWTHHHVLLDGWSGSILLDEFFSAYRAIQTGKVPELEARRPFGDYIEWLRERDQNASEAFWRNLLLDFNTPTALGSTATATLTKPDHDEPHQQSLRLSAQSTQTLQEFARQTHVTFNTLLQCSWGVQLSHWSGQLDVIFGATVSGRAPELSGADCMIGLLINTLPVRIRVRDQVTVSSLLQEVQQQAIEARQFEYTPLIQIHSWSGVPHRFPLFESVLIYENFPQATWTGSHTDSLEITNVRSLERTSFPLALIATLDKQLTLKIIYDRHRFDDGTITRLLEQMRTLLLGMAADSQRLVVEVPYISVLERRLLEKTEDDAERLSQPRCVHHIFEQQAQAAPSAPVVSFGEKILSYRELDDQANQLARYLRARGVRRETTVAVFLERGTEMIVSILAVLKAGGAYVLLDPNYPQERIAFMLADVGAGVLIATSSLRSLLPPANARHVLALDLEAALIAQEPCGTLATTVTPQNLAYIIYTSGSTGRPKAVMLTHAGLCRVIDVQIEKFAISPGGRVLQFASPSFDACTSEIFGALLAGACLCLAPRARLYPGQELADLIAEQDITTVTLPPSALAVTPCEGLSGLHTVVSAGEACTPALISRWSRVARLLNAYGPTEATICATISDPLAATDAPSIGNAIRHASVRLLDHHLQPVGIGSAGEVYIAGETLARGYLTCPDRTADRFIPDPLSSQPGARMYRTGDLAQYLPNGQIIFIGRIDDQVKIHGLRIELGEIEVALRRHPDLADCAVVVREDTSGDRVLAAYLVHREGRQPGVAALRTHLLRTLPDYMVPSRFVTLQRLPLTPNGKVDRGALPSLGTLVISEEAYLAPRTEMEQLVAAIWSEVLGVEKVSLQNNFFDLGGHSLKMIVVHGRLQAALNRKISMVDLFAYPSAGALARFLSGDRGPSETFDAEMRRADGYIASLQQQYPVQVRLEGSLEL